MLIREKALDTIRRVTHRQLRRAGYDVGKYPPRDVDADLVALYERVAPFTATPIERVAALRDAVVYLTEAQVPGPVVESGVWRGGSMMTVALTLMELGDTSRDLYLFDTYEGMAAPSEADVRVDGADAATLMAHEKKGQDNIWKVAGIEDVRRNMASTGYPEERIHYRQGLVQDTVPALAPDTIALLRLDTDWYDSTRHEMEHLFPRLVQRGVLILDDYGHWGGVRKAVDEYFEAEQRTLLLHRIDDAARMALKV